MATYRNKVEWRGEHQGYTWCQNGTAMEFSAPPDLFGLPGVLTPEDAFVAAGNTCYHMMVIWAVERFKIDLISFECEAEGEVEERLDRTSWFKKLTLYPKLVVKNKPREVVQRALDLALKYSTICQSFKSEVSVVPTIIVQ
jgi:organic hydroperoxide reductase OsmC/OhrA